MKLAIMTLVYCALSFATAQVNNDFWPEVVLQARTDGVFPWNRLEARADRSPPRDGAYASVKATGPATTFQAGSDRVMHLRFIGPNHSGYKEHSGPTQAFAGGKIQEEMVREYPEHRPRLKVKARGRFVSASIQTGPGGRARYKAHSDGHSPVADEMGSNDEKEIAAYGQAPGSAKIAARLNGQGSVIVHGSTQASSPPRSGQARNTAIMVLDPSSSVHSRRT